MDSRVRATHLQLSTMLEYMETHGDLARPQHGPQGRVWADWKSKTKKKGLAIRQHSRGTGGGPASRQTLSAIEERVLALMGVLAVEGQVSVEELGFHRSQSPVPDDPEADHTLYLEIVDAYVWDAERLWLWDNTMTTFTKHMYLSKKTG